MVIHQTYLFYMIYFYSVAIGVRDSYHKLALLIGTEALTLNTFCKTMSAQKWDQFDNGTDLTPADPMITCPPSPGGAVADRWDTRGANGSTEGITRGTGGAGGIGVHQQINWNILSINYLL